MFKPNEWFYMQYFLNNHKSFQWKDICFIKMSWMQNVVSFDVNHNFDNIPLLQLSNSP